MKYLTIVTSIVLLFSLETSAEPKFRYDERTDPNKSSSNTNTTTPPAPTRPAYFDSYKKNNHNADRVPASSPAPYESVSQPSTMQQDSFSQSPQVDPAILQKVQQVQQAQQQMLQQIDGGLYPAPTTAPAATGSPQ